jgi:hypothetical protein
MTDRGYFILLNSTSILVEKSRHRSRLVREVINIELDANDMNMEARFSLSRSSKLHSLTPSRKEDVPLHGQMSEFLLNNASLAPEAGKSGCPLSLSIRRGPEKGSYFPISQAQISHL